MSQGIKGIGGKILLLLLVLAILAGLTLGLSAYVVSSTQASLLDPDGPAPEGLDCVLVLGCGVRPDGSPSDMLADRLEQGIALYQAGWADKLLLSGDNGQENYNEVGVMEAYALERGVPGEDIVLDHAGFCTYDSVYRARDIFGAKRLVIITQAYHLSRALYIAQALGLDAWGVGADLRPYRGQAVRELREVLARDKDFFWALAQPDPKFLGEKLPLHPQ